MSESESLGQANQVPNNTDLTPNSGRISPVLSTPLSTPGSTPPGYVPGVHFFSNTNPSRSGVAPTQIDAMHTPECIDLTLEGVARNFLHERFFLN